MGNAEDKYENQRPIILIVEDHDALRDSLKSWVSFVFQDCNILVAKSGEDAIEKVFAQPPDIILMDVLLPGLNGIETTRRIKDVVPKAKVVMLSIHEGSAYQADASMAGSCAYIPKRKMGAELIPLITELLSGRTSQRLKKPE